MEDVILDNQPVSVVVTKNGGVKLKMLGWGWHLYGIIVKGLIMALLLSINFCLFAKAGGYALFGEVLLPKPEIVNILLSIFCVSMLVMLLLSFSEWLQNIMLALVAGLFTAMMINQFALFDKDAFMTRGMLLYLGEGAAAFVDGRAWLVMSGLVAALTLVYLWMSSRSNQMYLIGTLAVINVWILFSAYMDRNNNNNFIYEYDTSSAGVENGKKFINIYLSNAAPYGYLNEMKDANAKDNSKLENLQKIMLGFYNRNNFDIYTNAYVEHKDAPKNQAEVLNPLVSGNKNFTTPASHQCCDWQFRPIKDKTDYLLGSRLTEIFKKSQYKVSAYQSRGLDMCHLYGQQSLDRCLNKASLPADVSVLAAATSEKIKLLYGQWLESTGLFAPDSVAAAFLPDSFKNRYDKLYVVNSLQALDLAAIDIANDKGSGAYLVYVDMPADMFIYNEFCMVKPTEQWLPMHDRGSADSPGTQARRNAYAEQYACLLGKLQNFMDTLTAKGADKNAVVVIEGVSSAQDKEYKETDRTELNFGANHAVTMAIRDPLHKENLIKTEICKASEITAAYLFKKAQCTEFKGLNLSEEDRTQLKKALSARNITPEEINKADNFFTLWYPYWQKANGIEVKELPAETAVKPEQQAPDNPTPQPEAAVNKPAPITENTIVKENKIIEKEIPVEPEAPTASLKAEMLKNPLTEETPAIDTPESQLETAVQPEASTTQTQPADKQENEPQPQPIENIETVKNETPLSSNTADAPENLLPQSNEASRQQDNTAATTTPAADKQ